MKYSLNKNLYAPLGFKGIKIGGGRKMVLMSVLKSFLNVEVTKVSDHLGSHNGWTKYQNNEIGLTINGGFYKGEEYVDGFLYGNKLHNPYNNYVNVFYILDFLTEEGKKYFFSFYREEILKLIRSKEVEIRAFQKRAMETQSILSEIKNEVEPYLLR